jgi:hypothetical protein
VIQRRPNGAETDAVTLRNGEAPMRFRTYRNTPLWFDLLLASGAITLAHLLDQVIRPPRRAPRFDEAFPPENRERSYHDDSLNPEKGAIGRRPSQEPHRLQRARAEEAGRGRSARHPLAHLYSNRRRQTARDEKIVLQWAVLPPMPLRALRSGFRAGTIRAALWSSHSITHT